MMSYVLEKGETCVKKEKTELHTYISPFFRHTLIRLGMLTRFNMFPKHSVPFSQRMTCIFTPQNKESYLYRIEFIYLLRNKFLSIMVY